MLDRRALLHTLLAAPAAILAGSRRAVAMEGRCLPTAPDVAGPFYLPGAPRRLSLAAATEPGDRIAIRGRVLSADCRTAVAGALLDVWQADAKGEYHGKDEQYRLRGQILTGPDGSYEIHSIRPGNYRQANGWRPAHLHFTVSAPRHQPVTTQLYFRGDPYLAPHDSCGSECHSDDAHRIVALEPGKGKLTGLFDVTLKMA
ncbi:MAG: twin-arginine translocation pathway signal protein [Acidobacteriota bacterium]|nr:twin-arginine translocation pathway signal protein [Acidobacteriota bacterium]